MQVCPDHWQDRKVFSKSNFPDGSVTTWIAHVCIDMYRIRLKYWDTSEGEYNERSDPWRNETQWDTVAAQICDTLVSPNTSPLTNYGIYLILVNARGKYTQVGLSLESNLNPKLLNGRNSWKSTYPASYIPLRCPTIMVFLGLIKD